MVPCRFDVYDNDFECGVGGVPAGAGMRICNKSREFRVFRNRFYGSLVTQMHHGPGVNPPGDRWGGVGLNIDCSVDNHLNSNQFKGGGFRIFTNGTD